MIPKLSNPLTARFGPRMFLLGGLLLGSSVSALGQPAIRVDFSTPKATYRLNDPVPITINVANTTPRASGNDSAANAAANARNTARGFRVDTFVLVGRDIYGNQVNYVLNGPGIGDIGPEDSQSVVFDFVIPNDGTLHNVDPGYLFLGNSSWFDPAGGLVQRRRDGTDRNVLIGVVPDIALENISFRPGSYRGGDIIRLNVLMRNRFNGEPGRQGRPLRPTAADQFRLDTRLSIAPAFGVTPANEFRLYFDDLRGDLGNALGLAGFTPNESTVIREVRVLDTPAAPPGYGVLSTAIANMTTDAQGRVTNLAIANGGVGFVNGETIRIQAAQVTGGTTFEGIAVVANGILTAVNIVNRGSGYLPGTVQPVTLINAAGRNYNPQPYDGFLDLGEVLEMVVEVRLPDNFSETYYVTGQVDSLNNLVEPRPDDNVVPYPDTTDAAGGARLVNNNTFVSSRATRIILQSSGYPSTSLMSGVVPAPGEPGVSADNFSDQAVVSGSGEWVAFVSAATNLLNASGQQTNGKKQIFARQPSTGALTLVSASNAGTQGNGDCLNPAISANGRFVAFESVASNLVPGDRNGASDIFVRDLTSSGLSDQGDLVRISVNADGVEGNGGSFNPSLSADGRFVAFESEARNLDKNRKLGAAAGSTLVYVHNRSVDGKLPYDRRGNTSTRLVSINNSNQPANGFTGFARISGDATAVAFSSYAPNLNSGGSRVQQVYRILLSNGAAVPATLLLVSQTAGGLPGNDESYQPSINGNGTQIAFTSDADSLVAGDTNGVADIFVRDLVRSRTTRISVSNPRRASGTISFVAPVVQRGLAPANNPVPNSSVTIGDGVRTVRFVFGRTAAETPTVRNVPIGLNGGQTRDNLVQAIRLSALDVDVYASTPPPSGAGLLKAPYSPAIFLSAITPGTAGNRAITTDSAVLEVRGLTGGGTQATDPANLPAFSPPGSITPSISADGRYIAFRSVASNLAVFEQASGQFAQGFKNGDLLRPQLGFFADVYVHDRRKSGKGNFDRAGNTATEILSVSTFGGNTRALLDVQSSGNNQAPSISADGQFVAFSSDAESTAGLVFGASNLVPLDTNGYRDVFLRNRNLGGSQPPLPPENLPVVVFASPTQEAVTYVTGSTVPLAVDASAAPGKTIRQVEFSVNGTVLTTLTAAPYFTTFRLTAPGTYKVVATVTDNFGVQSQSFVTVTAAAPIVDAPTLSVTHPTPGGAGDTANDFSDASSFFLNALALPGAGAALDFVAGVNLDSGGQGYTSAPRVTIAGGGGKGATAVARVSQGRVIAIELTNRGTGYTSVPDIRFSGGGGNGAAATAFLNAPTFFANGRLLGGSVAEVRVTAGGSGYTTVPEVRIQGGGGSGAAARAVVTRGRVTAVQILNGGRGYTTPPVVEIVGNGTGAKAKAELSGPVRRLGDQYGIFWRPDATGVVQITAQVSDSRGNTVVSAPLAFTIDPLIRPLPSVRMEPVSAAVSPKAGSQVLLEATYRANSPTFVSRVDFYANQVYIGAWEPTTAQERGEGIASVVWIPEQAGTYSLSARVMQVLAEPGDNSVVSPNLVSINIRPATPDVGSPPVILLTDPVSEPRLARGSSVYINVTATDPDGVMADNGVKIFIDGQPQTGVRRYGDTWSVRWTPTENSRFFVTASAIDSDGNAVALPRTQFEVAQALNLLPQVQFDQVLGGAQLSRGDPLTLRARARFFNSLNTNRVDFYANGVLIGTGVEDAGTGTGGFRGYSLAWTPDFGGRVVFSAKAVSVNYTTRVDNDNVITTHGAVLSGDSAPTDINVITGNTPNQRFVRDIYPILLNRSATFAEWDFYVKALDAGRLDQADVVIGIMDYRAGTQVFGADAEYGRTTGMAYAAFLRLGLAPSLPQVQSFLATLRSDGTLLPLTDYPPLPGAPYGATLGLAAATQAVFQSPAFVQLDPTVLSYSNIQFIAWLRDKVFPGRPLGDVARLVPLMESLPLIRQGAAMAFLSRLVLVAGSDTEKLFQRQLNSTALQFMLSGGRVWRPNFGVNNPYSKAVVQSLLTQYPVGAAGNVSRAAEPSAAAGSYAGVINRARLNGNAGGSITATITAQGVVTGTVAMQGRTLGFRGTVDANGRVVAVTDSVLGKAGYRLDLDLTNTGRPDARLAGSIRSGQQVATLSALLSPWGGGLRAGAYAGTYAVRLNEVAAAAKNNPAVPTGARGLEIQVRPNGVVNVVGQVADGFPLSWSGRLAGDGSIMLHVDIPGRGSLMGTIDLKVAANKNVTPSGSLVWQSPKQGTKAAFRLALSVQPL